MQKLLDFILKLLELADRYVPLALFAWASRMKTEREELKIAIAEANMELEVAKKENAIEKKYTGKDPASELDGHIDFLDSEFGADFPISNVSQLIPTAINTKPSKKQ